MSNSSASPLDSHSDSIKQWAAEGHTNAEIAARIRDEFGIVTSEASIRRAKKRAGVSPAPKTAGLGTKKEPALAINGDTATAVSPVTGVPMSIPELMKLYKLDQEEWEPENPIASWWGDPTRPSYQLKVKFTRKKDIVFVVPARAEGNYKAPRISRRTTSAPRIHILFGCQQAPFEDKGMHAAMLGMIADLRPHGFVAMGDTLDFPTVSRHADEPEWSATVQECIDGGYRLLRDYRAACEDMEMHKLLGNHDTRVRTEILTRAERLYGIRPGAGEEEAPQRELLSMENMLRLDELNIQLVKPKGKYTHAQLDIGNVALIHGNKTGPNAALRELNRNIHSVVMAHTHTQALGKKVVYDIEGRRRTLIAAEIGTGTTIDGGLGYTVKPDWINGGGVLITHPDGRQNVELFEWDGRHILWRDRLYA